MLLVGLSTFFKCKEFLLKSRKKVMATFPAMYLISLRSAQAKKTS
jgi:hypothetical protein